MNDKQVRGRPRVAVIGGDGIGPEVTQQAMRVLDVAMGGQAPQWDILPYCADYTLETGVTIPEGEIQRIGGAYDAVFLGALGDPRIPDMRHGRDILLGMRRELDLYINLRPVRLLAERLCPLKGRGPKDVQIMIFRENTEGLYAGIGSVDDRGGANESATTHMVATRRGTERIIRAAFDYARAHGCQSLCMADKSNAIPHAHGVWQRLFKEIAPEYDEIQSFHLYADVAAMELVRNPGRFDVIVTGNLLGDVLSDLGAQIAGGLGVAPSANLNPGRCSLFEPVHGSAPDLAGRGLANPLAAILTAAMLADHLGAASAAREIERAVSRAIIDGATTSDLGGDLDTQAAGEAVCARLSSLT